MERSRLIDQIERNSTRANTYKRTDVRCTIYRTGPRFTGLPGRPCTSVEPTDMHVVKGTHRVLHNKALVGNAGPYLHKLFHRPLIHHPPTENPYNPRLALIIRPGVTRDTQKNDTASPLAN